MKLNTQANWGLTVMIALILIVGVIIGLFIPSAYNSWKREIYDTGYNQSRIDTIVGIADRGIYPTYWRTENTTALVFATYNQLCGVEQ